MTIYELNELEAEYERVVGQPYGLTKKDKESPTSAAALLCWFAVAQCGLSVFAPKGDRTKWECHWSPREGTFEYASGDDPAAAVHDCLKKMPSAAVRMYTPQTVFNHMADNLHVVPPSTRTA